MAWPDLECSDIQTFLTTIGKNMSKKIMKTNKNFSLVELLVVIAIIAVLAGGVISQLGETGRAAARTQASKDIAHLIEKFNTFTSINKGRLPKNLDAMVSNTVSASTNDEYVDNGAASTHAASGSVGLYEGMIDYFGGFGDNTGKVQKNHIIF